MRGEGVGTPPGARKGGGRAAGVFGQGGFTLLEVLIVVFILGLLTAMVIPGLNQLDHRERTRITREGMDLIRRAILGPEDRFDSAGRPLIGGYVGDMKDWPDLWEARAELRPTFAGTGWENPPSMSAGLGQGPDYDMDPAKVFYRPSGSFAGGNWNWHRPYRRLRDDATNHYDHIGGLETENEGQPRGLWTRYPEELSFDLPGHPAPGADLGDDWKGPYLAPPLPQKGGGGQHLARNDADYADLDPIGGSWEDGDYNPVSGLGENFDDKEAFRLLQTDGRLADGWGRAFRFFITEDTAHPGETIFWVLSEGPDGAGVYPTKGSYSGGWSIDPDDTMGRNYDASHPLNRDNMVMKLYSRDWKGVFAAQDADRAEQTRRLLERIRVALVGDSPRGRNHGFTGDLGRWPKLFRWDGGAWDDEEAADTPYTKGQPRELWTRTPYSSDLSNKMDDSKWGFGWRHAYLGAPQGGPGENEVLRDAWGRKFLFFYDDANDALLILSRGKDGKYSFDAEPDNYTEALNVGAYDPAAADNEDNLHLVVRASDWRSGYFRLDKLVVLNATVGVTKCRFFRDGGAPLAGDLLTALVLTDEDGDGLPDDWAAGSGPANPAFNFDDTTTQKVFTGARYLVCWNDADGNDEIDSGEPHLPFIFNVTADAGSGQFGSLTINSADFRSAP